MFVFSFRMKNRMSNNNPSFIWYTLKFPAYLVKHKKHWWLFCPISTYVILTFVLKVKKSCFKQFSKNWHFLTFLNLSFPSLSVCPSSESILETGGGHWRKNNEKAPSIVCFLKQQQHKQTYVFFHSFFECCDK